MDDPMDSGGGTTTATPPAPTPDAGGSEKSWQVAAAGAGPAPTGQTPGAQQPATGSAAGTPPQAQPTPVTTVPAPPPTAARVPRKGLGGIIDRVADSLAGTDTSRVRTDPDGNLYIQHETPTRGQQWLKIGAEALVGAAAGMAQTGAGGKAKAAQAGIQAGQQMKKQQTEQEKDQMLQVANSQALKHQIVAQAFEMQHKVTEAAQHDIEFSEGQADRLTKQGGTLSGHVENLQDLTKFMRETPNFNKDQVGKDIYTPVATFDANGKPNGFDVYAKTPGSDEEMQPAGTKVPFFNPVTGEMTYQKTSGPKSTADINAIWLAAGNASHKYALDQAEIDERNANAEAKKNPKPPLESAGAAAEHRASAARSYAAADLDKVKADQLKAGKILDDGTPNPRFEEMAAAMERGDILPQDLKREAKGANLDPNELMGRAAEIAKANGRNFSLPIIEQEHKFASSPKTQAALDGIDRVIGAPGAPGYMDQMLSLAQKADLGTNGAMNSAGLAVKRFFGDNAAKNFQTSVSETRRSIAGLIGNPLLGGSETDKKLQQADEMLGESPTLENLKGAAAVLKQALATQKQSIVGNNRYLRQRYGATGQAALQPQMPAAAPGGLSFSKGAYLKANPGGNVNAAAQAAAAAGHPVVD